MALLSMAVHDLDSNGRSEYTLATLTSLIHTVDFTKHRLFISDNGSCNETHKHYESFRAIFKAMYGHTDNFTLILNGENLGTAEAINKCWQNRRLSEAAIKLDNDIVIHCNTWVEQLEEVISRNEHIGLVALKRKDIWQHPNHQDLHYQTSLSMLPHEPGQRWIVIENCSDIMGSCVMHSAKLLDEIGYLFQPGLYGFDDVLCSIRSLSAGFRNCFLPHIDIDHIDRGGDSYCDWKQKYAGEQMHELNTIIAGYRNGTRPLYYNPFQ